MDANNECRNNIQPTKKSSFKKVRFSEDCGPTKPEYKELSRRLDTFKRRSWPPSLPQSPQKLAEAGFYYTGNID